ncbi:MAG TPA: FKBP-type peptidyl-prolyl cis-trans isomerase [Candidatus Polarisedimenticolaceae bacterium]
MVKRITLVLLAACLTALPVLAAEPKIESEQDKTLYALGLFLSRNLGAFQLTEAELEVVKAGLSDGVLNKPKKAELETYGPKINELQKARMVKAAESHKAGGKAFVDKLLAANKNLRKTGSGLVMETITEGTGASPTATDRVKVHYTGTLIDGTVFDSSVKKGQPLDRPLNQVIPCWTEAFQFLKPGAKAKLYCPSDIAYGDQGRPGIPPGATLIFEVELLEVLK